MTEDPTAESVDASAGPGTEPAPDEPTSDELRGSDADRAAAPSRRRGSTLVAVLVVALLVASGLAVWQTLRLADAEGDADRRTEAAQVASELTIALLSYDFEDLDAQADRIAELATEDFADEFDDAMAGGLGASIEELQARSTAAVTEVMVSEVPGDRARAIVLADSEITSDAGSRASTDTYLDISLVHLDGRWQVDDVRTVATRSPDSPSPDGEAPAEEDDGEGGEQGDEPADEPAEGDVGAADPAG